MILWQVIEDDVVTDLTKACHSGSYEKLEKTVKVRLLLFLCTLFVVQLNRVIVIDQVCV